MQSDKVTPIILAGGTGTRLWPSSREMMPKQFCQIEENLSLFQKTCHLTKDRMIFNDPIVVTNEKYEPIVRQQLSAADTNPRHIILEPVGRDTAAAIALATALPGLSAKQTFLVMPADHFFGAPHVLLEAICSARVATRDRKIITFGIKPSRPETGFGYILAQKKSGEAIYSTINKFVEKPPLHTAQQLIRDPNALWNSGLFLFEKSTIDEEFNKHAPELYEKVRDAIRFGSNADRTIRPSGYVLETLKPISFDYAIMEHTKHAAVVPMDPKWSDVGSWKAMWQISDKDKNRNSVSGDVFLSDVSDSIVKSNGPTVGVVGLSDIAVVVEKDAVLVAKKECSQDVKNIVQEMRRAGSPVSRNHNGESRPWGRFDSLDKGDNHHVKRIQVDCGGRLSLQYHHHRSEHWIIVRGTATVTVDGEVKTLGVGERVFIPQGATHRLENLAHEPVEIIEIQVGDYFGEDDIVRLEDIYGRNDETGSNIDTSAAA